MYTLNITLFQNNSRWRALCGAGEVGGACDASVACPLLPRRLRAVDRQQVFQSFMPPINLQGAGLPSIDAPIGKRVYSICISYA